MNPQLAANLEKKRLGLGLALEAVMTDDAAKVLAYGRNKNRRHEARIALMQGYEIKDQQIEDEDDLIQVGDTTIHQYMPGAPAAAAAPSEPASGAATTDGAATTVVSRYAAIAALLAGLAGAGTTAAPTIAQWLAAAAEVKVLWDGQEIKPGESATAQSPPPS